jgi:hypothetical protein
MTAEDSAVAAMRRDFDMETTIGREDRHLPTSGIGHTGEVRELPDRRILPRHLVAQ